MAIRAPIFFWDRKSMAWKRSSIFSWKERRARGLRKVREPISVRNLRISAWKRTMMAMMR